MNSRLQNSPAATNKVKLLVKESDKQKMEIKALKRTLEVEKKLQSDRTVVDKKGGASSDARRQLENELKNRDALLKQKDEELREINDRVHKTETELKQKDNELSVEKDKIMQEKSKLLEVSKEKS